MKKTLWKIFKVVTFGIGIFFYIGEAATVYEELKSKDKPIIRLVMFPDKK